MLCPQLDSPQMEHAMQTLPSDSPAYNSASLNLLAGPFPNLRCREVVKDIVDRVVQVAMFCNFTEKEVYTYALGLVQGARIVAEKDDSTALEMFVVELLSKLNRGGVDALKELVEAVTGHGLELTVAEAA